MLFGKSRELVELQARVVLLEKRLESLIGRVDAWKEPHIILPKYDLPLRWLGPIEENWYDLPVSMAVGAIMDHLKLRFVYRRGEKESVAIEKQKCPRS